MYFGLGCVIENMLVLVLLYGFGVVFVVDCGVLEFLDGCEEFWCVVMFDFVFNLLCLMDLYVWDFYVIILRWYIN